MKNTTPLESEEQINFVEYCKSRNIIVVSTQNGFKMPKQGFNFIGYSKKLTKMGLSKGFPDLMIFTKNKSKTDSVLFIEMKRQKGGVISDEQKKWHTDLCNAGYAVGIAKGCDSAIRILNKYLET